MSSRVEIRPGRDDDAAAFIDIVSSCWAEYPGCVTDIDGEVPELRRLATYAAGRGGAVWASEVDGKVVGMICTYPLAEGDGWELAKMYLHRSYRGADIAQALVRGAEAYARAHGARRMRLWTDTRFDRAHRFYEKRGYVRSGPIRVLDDLSKSIEFAYQKPLIGIEVMVLDAAAANSAEPRLAEILRDCVQSGASVSYLPPLELDAARAFWKRVSSDVATGRRILLVAWAEGVLGGTVQLNIVTRQNQPHRADVEMLLVLPEFRRLSMGRTLLMAVEQAARTAGRGLLLLETRAGDAAEALCRSAGWVEVGRIPDYTLNADGTFSATLVFSKRL